MFYQEYIPEPIESCSSFTDVSGCALYVQRAEQLCIQSARPEFKLISRIYMRVISPRSDESSGSVRVLQLVTTT